MKIAIIDDELDAQALVEKYIYEWANKNKILVVVDRFESSESFLFHWDENKDYDLLVLDIEMREINGLELARRIRVQDNNIKLIFVTGYDEYIQYGYDVSALNYLIKPVNKERLLLTLDKLSSTKGTREEYMLVNTESDVRKINISDIFFVEANGHGSVLHISHDTIKLRESIGEIERKTALYNSIVKCHRAYLVSLQYISAIQGTDIILDDSTRIPVSRNQMKNVQKEFIKYYRKQD